MSNEVQTPSEEVSITVLVTGIIDDARELLRQQVLLLNHEIKEDLRRAREAAIAMAVGAGILLIGAVQVAWLLPHLLNWSIPGLPLWACYGLVGTALAIIGGIVLLVGKRRIKSAVPDQSVEALKENFTWTTNRN